MNSRDPSKFSAAACGAAAIPATSAAEEENHEEVGKESDDELEFGLFD